MDCELDLDEVFLELDEVLKKKQKDWEDLYLDEEFITKPLPKPLTNFDITIGKAVTNDEKLLFHARLAALWLSDAIEGINKQ